MASQLLLGHQVTRRAMGVTATITVNATDPLRLIERGFSLLNRYEFLWSRFIPQSDLSRLNNAGGEIIGVAPETVELIAHMKVAHQITAGRYNPTLLPMHREHNDLASLVDNKRCLIPDNARTWLTLDDITFHSNTSVSLPPSMTLDAGGIGKGVAADLIAEDLLEQGAQSVSINIGGDARVASAEPTHESWNFDIIDLQMHSPASSISLLNGALATSSIDARHRGGIGPSRHIFSTDNYSQRIRTCSVIAPQARWAEVWTKFVMLSQSPTSDIAHQNMAALTVDNSGEIFMSPSWKEFQL